MARAERPARTTGAQQGGGSEQERQRRTTRSEQSLGIEADARTAKTDRRPSRARALGANILHGLAPTPDPNAPPEAEAQQSLLWSERIQRSHASDGMHSMLRSLLADLPKVRTPVGAGASHAARPQPLEEAGHLLVAALALLYRQPGPLRRPAHALRARPQPGEADARGSS